MSEKFSHKFEGLEDEIRSAKISDFLVSEVGVANFSAYARHSELVDKGIGNVFLVHGYSAEGADSDVFAGVFEVERDAEKYVAELRKKFIVE